MVSVSGWGTLIVGLPLAYSLTKTTAVAVGLVAACFAVWVGSTSAEPKLDCFSSCHRSGSISWRTHSWQWKYLCLIPCLVPYQFVWKTPC